MTTADHLGADAAACVAEVAAKLGETMTAVADVLYQEFVDEIPELRGDTVILELLRSSTFSNVETFLHVCRHAVSIDDVTPPVAALEYARRLAHRGTPTNAVLRAYRLGQRRLLGTFLDLIEERAAPDVAYAAARLVQSMAFSYIDYVSERVVAEYEVERERWLANRNTVRATTLTAILGDEDLDLGAAENALGYRLRQHHLGVVAWDGRPGSSSHTLRALEHLIGETVEIVGASGSPLFIAQDGSSGWGWIPLGRSGDEVGPERLAELDRRVAEEMPTARIAIGRPGAAVDGFRTSHREARRAHEVASVAGDRAAHVTSYDEPGVRTVALLTDDLAAARELVASSLGGLAVDDEGAERLRDTLLTFLSEKRSYLATAERVHLHKNTVKYRVDKAIEARGRAIDDDRLNLELALLAARWLGPAVLLDRGR